METLIKNVPHAQPFALKGQVEYEGGKVVSLTLAQQPGAGITLFALMRVRPLAPTLLPEMLWRLFWKERHKLPLTALPTP